MVKLEGAGHKLEVIRFLAERDIPVCGHLGLTPQSVLKLGGYKVQGRDEQAAAQLRSDAAAVAEAGASLLVLECVPSALAADITAASAIPTIGIGAGPRLRRPVLVLPTAGLDVAIASRNSSRTSWPGRLGGWRDPGSCRRGARRLVPRREHSY